jgi:hypothetical protein
MKSLAFALLALIISGQLALVYAQLGKGDSPFERNFADIKYTNAYFGTLGNKIEVTPGDKNVPFTVIFANVGTTDITGVKGQLSLPIGFSAANNKNGIIYADSGSEVLGGRYFGLTFYVDLNKDLQIQQYPGTVKVDYSRFRESGNRQSFFEFMFKVTGKSILNLNADNPFLTSLKNNLVTVEVTNTGTAPMSNVEIVLQNTQTSVSSTANPITNTNTENVVFDQSKWDVGTIQPISSKTFSFNVYIPEGIRSETLHTPLEVSYFDGHGNKIVDNKTVNFFINGLIDLKIYDVNVINLSGKQTVIGEIINEGNTNALFGFVTLEPLGDSNIKKTTEFIDEIETDSPVPFNIPIEFNGEPKFDEHKIKITLRYKDDSRNEHLLDYNTTISLKDTTKKLAPTISDYMPGIVGLAIAAAAGVIIFKKLEKRKNLLQAKAH